LAGGGLRHFIITANCRTFGIRLVFGRAAGECESEKRRGRKAGGDDRHRGAPTTAAEKSRTYSVVRRWVSVVAY
jgi:hypothetical protein